MYSRKVYLSVPNPLGMAQKNKHFKDQSMIYPDNRDVKIIPNVGGMASEGLRSTVSIHRDERQIRGSELITTTKPSLVSSDEIGYTMLN